VIDLASPPIPVPDPETAGFWQAIADGELAIARCADCRRWQHPPTEACRHCGGVMRFEPVSGRGTVFSFIVVRQPTVPGHEAPYVVAIVELAEQADVRLSGILRVAPDEVRVGLAVTAVIEPVGTSEFSAPEFVAAP
jgi:uncharacterized protein